jgi:hypothetical protein
MQVHAEKILTNVSEKAQIFQDVQEDRKAKEA